jgi:hypothetical protein
MYCQGSRVITQDDVETNYVSWTQRIVTSNIIAQPPGLLKHTVQLTPVNLNRYAEMSLQFGGMVGGGCWHNEWSRKCSWH